MTPRKCSVELAEIQPAFDAERVLLLLEERQTASPSNETMLRANYAFRSHHLAVTHTQR